MTYAFEFQHGKGGAERNKEKYGKLGTRIRLGVACTGLTRYVSTMNANFILWICICGKHMYVVEMVWKRAANMEFYFILGLD